MDAGPRDRGAAHLDLGHRSGRDEHASRRLARAIRGRGAFRHFKDELYEEYPDLVSVWHTFRDVRARRRAVEWLLDEGLIDATEAAHYLKGHPDPALP